MKKFFFAMAFVVISGLVYQRVSAEVYDLDALTGDGTQETNTNTSDTQPATTNTNTNATTTNTNTASEPTDQALNFAECIIYRKLEIDDARCDKLMAGFSCPDYARLLTHCEDQYQQCLGNTSKKYSNNSYSGCGANYKSCTDYAVSSYPACGKKFPARQVTGEKTTQFNLTNASGDVRVFYEDDPTPFDMEAVAKDRTIQTGAAIFTGDTGNVTLALPNGVVQHIGPNTYFRIADYYSSDTFDNTYTVLKNGNIRVGITNPDTQQVGYTVITPLWKVSAKGTQFEVTVNDDGTEEVSVTEGTVRMVSLTDDGEEVTLAAGDSVTSDEFGEIAGGAENDYYGEGDYTFKSKLLNAWYTERWAFVGVAVLVIGVIVAPIAVRIHLARRKRRSG